jgi:cytochrome c oxidase assembly protein subunit 15
MPTGPVTLSKAWIEMLHRYFAMGVGVLIIAINIWAWMSRGVLGQRIMWTSFGILILVCVQGAFGAWTVTMKLQPIIVTIHLMLGLSLLASLVYLYTISHLDQSTSWQMRVTQATYPSGWLTLAFIALIMQIFLGGWVSTNYAVLACEDFPLCHGQWVPVMDMKAGFQLWRELGLTKTGEILPLPALVAIHWVHRVMAVLVLSILFILAYKVYRYGKSASVRHQHLGLILAFLALLQLLTGMSNIILDWPLIAALMHTGGAAAILVVLVRLLPLSRRLS